ncbi:MAG: hypothetical protein ACXAC5_04750 [Promethearchaeota archaeon]|jgi:hypothetical protein
MYTLVVLVFALVATWFIFRMARKAWRKADIEEVKSKVEDTEDVYESAKNINAKKFQKQHDKVEEIKEATDL